MQTRRTTLLLTRHDGRVRSLAFDPRYLVTASVTLVLLLLGTTLYSGLRLGIDLEARAHIDEVHDLLATTQAQHARIRALDSDTRNHLDALALRLGRMQAQLLRLDAAGKRMVDVIDLDQAEFDFDRAPPVGGPDNAATVTEHTVPDFLAMLDELEHAVEDRRHKLSLLEQLIVHRQVSRQVTPSGEVVPNGVLSSRYGTRIDPFTGKRAQHKGIDIAGKRGSAVLAAGAGVVTFAGVRTGYGNLVEIDHGDGYLTRYAHNRSHLVSTGETVHKGQPVAVLGSTGRSTGPHVHVEVVKHGKTVNPAHYLAH